ncbi:MAG: BON domain-containing protein [Thermoanaerobaculales bacterium]|jgi:osmotically-inducible protein OsmY|nr:BON domain-containing protein [Thermoanaerobaculales bacterium]
MKTHTEHPLTLKPLLTIAVLAIGLTTFSGCGQGEPTFEPVDTSALEEEPTVVDNAVDQITLPIEVRLALLNELGVDGLRIEPEVEGNRVILAGIVHDPASQVSAEAIVSEIDGINEVFNTIAVTPTEGAGPATEVSEELKQELADELLEAEVALRVFTAIGADASRLEIQAARGTVTLGGLVSSTANKAEAVTAAEGALGAVEVLDFIEVSDPIIVEEQHEQE